MTLHELAFIKINNLNWKRVKCTVIHSAAAKSYSRHTLGEEQDTNKRPLGFRKLPQVIRHNGRHLYSQYSIDANGTFHDVYGTDHVIDCVSSADTLFRLRIRMTLCYEKIIVAVGLRISMLTYKGRQGFVLYHSINIPSITMYVIGDSVMFPPAQLRAWSSSIYGTHGAGHVWRRIECAMAGRHTQPISKRYTSSDSYISWVLSLRWMPVSQAH